MFVIFRTDRLDEEDQLRGQPDHLSPLDFFLREYLKGRRLRTKPHTFEELRPQIASES